MTTNDLYREYIKTAEEAGPSLLDEYENIVAYMKGCTAIHHGEYVRTCYIPKLFTEEDFRGIVSDIRILYGIFEKVIKEYFRSESYRRLFGFDPITEKLILRSNPDLSLLPMARIDFFFHDDTKEYKFCEFNTDGTSAMNEDRELHLAQSNSSSYRIFRERYKTRICELFDTWVSTVLRLYRKSLKQKGAGNENFNDSDFCNKIPYVAICDFMEFGTVSEFGIFQDHFTAKGIPAEVCDIRDLHYDAKAKVLYSASGKKVDVIYRRAVTSDILAHYEEALDFIRAVTDNAVLLLGDFHTQLIHNKMIFCILHDCETAKLLTPKEQEFIKIHVPVTKLFEKNDIVSYDLLNTRENWILKPLDSYGSKGIHAGCESDKDAWKKIVLSIPEQGYILQEFHTPYVTKNYGYKDGVFGKYDYYNLTGIYTYDGVPTGVYSRVSLTPIISSQYSEKTLPTLIIDS